MVTTSTAAAGFALSLTDEERTFLLNFLESALRDKQVEAHRTDAPGYRVFVEHEVAIMQGLIDRLRR
jgi:hypothetical protein